jgi:hypothetical protein
MMMAAGTSVEGSAKIAMRALRIAVSRQVYYELALGEGRYFPCRRRKRILPSYVLWRTGPALRIALKCLTARGLGMFRLPSTPDVARLYPHRADNELRFY